MGRLNSSGLPQQHLRRTGPPASVSGVPDVMDFHGVTTIIGRNSAQVDYVIDSSDYIYSRCVSRSHARVVRQVQGNTHCLHDDSLNGVFINDIKILNSVVLQEGDSVTFGHPCGNKVQPGTRIRQPDSEYQFIFERCECMASPTSQPLQDIDVFPSENQPPEQFRIPNQPPCERLRRPSREVTCSFTPEDIHALRSQWEQRQGDGKVSRITATRERSPCREPNSTTESCDTTLLPDYLTGGEEVSPRVDAVVTNHETRPIFRACRGDTEESGELEVSHPEAVSVSDIVQTACETISVSDLESEGTDLTICDGNAEVLTEIVDSALADTIHRNLEIASVLSERQDTLAEVDSFEATVQHNLISDEVPEFAKVDETALSNPEESKIFGKIVEATPTLSSAVRGSDIDIFNTRVGALHVRECVIKGDGEQRVGENTPQAVGTAENEQAATSPGDQNYNMKTAVAADELQSSLVDSVVKTAAIVDEVDGSGGKPNVTEETVQKTVIETFAAVHLEKDVEDAVVSEVVDLVIPGPETLKFNPVYDKNVDLWDNFTKGWRPKDFVADNLDQTTVSTLRPDRVETNEIDKTLEEAVFAGGLDSSSGEKIHMEESLPCDTLNQTATEKESLPCDTLNQTAAEKESLPCDTLNQTAAEETNVDLLMVNRPDEMWEEGCLEGDTLTGDQLQVKEGYSDQVLTTQDREPDHTMEEKIRAAKLQQAKKRNGECHDTSESETETLEEGEQTVETENGDALKANGQSHAFDFSGGHNKDMSLSDRAYASCEHDQATESNTKKVDFTPDQENGWMRQGEVTQVQQDEESCSTDSVTRAAVVEEAVEDRHQEGFISDGQEQAVRENKLEERCFTCELNKTNEDHCCDDDEGLQFAEQDELEPSDETQHAQIKNEAEIVRTIKLAGAGDVDQKQSMDADVFGESDYTKAGEMAAEANHAAGVRTVESDKFKEAVEENHTVSVMDQLNQSNDFVTHAETNTTHELYQANMKRKQENIDDSVSHTEVAEESDAENEAAEELKALDEAAEELKAVDKAAEELKAVDKAAEELKAVDMVAEELKAVDEAAEESEAVDMVAEELKAVDMVAEELKAVDEAAEELKAVDEAAEELKAVDKAAEELKTVDEADKELKAVDEADKELKAVDEAAENLDVVNEADEELETVNVVAEESKADVEADEELMAVVNEVAEEHSKVGDMLEETDAEECSVGKAMADGDSEFNPGDRGIAEVVPVEKYISRTAMGLDSIVEPFGSVDRTDTFFTKATKDHDKMNDISTTSQTSKTDLKELENSDADLVKTESELDNTVSNKSASELDKRTSELATVNIVPLKHDSATMVETMDGDSSKVKSVDTVTDIITVDKPLIDRLLMEVKGHESVDKTLDLLSEELDIAGDKSLAETKSNLATVQKLTHKISVDNFMGADVDKHLTCVTIHEEVQESEDVKTFCSAETYRDFREPNGDETNAGNCLESFTSKESQNTSAEDSSIVHLHLPPKGSKGFVLQLTYSHEEKRLDGTESVVVNTNGPSEGSLLAKRSSKFGGIVDASDDVHDFVPSDYQKSFDKETFPTQEVQENRCMSPSNRTLSVTKGGLGADGTDLKLFDDCEDIHIHAQNSVAMSDESLVEIPLDDCIKLCDKAGKKGICGSDEIGCDLPRKLKRTFEDDGASNVTEETDEPCKKQSKVVQDQPSLIMQTVQTLFNVSKRMGGKNGELPEKKDLEKKTKIARRKRKIAQIVKNFFSFKSGSLDISMDSRDAEDESLNVGKFRKLEMDMLDCAAPENIEKPQGNPDKSRLCCVSAAYSETEISKLSIRSETEEHNLNVGTVCKLDDGKFEIPALQVCSSQSSGKDEKFKEETDCSSSKDLDGAVADCTSESFSIFELNDEVLDKTNPVCSSPSPELDMLVFHSGQCELPVVPAACDWSCKAVACEEETTELKKADINACNQDPVKSQDQGSGEMCEVRQEELDSRKTKPAGVLDQELTDTPVDSVLDLKAKHVSISSCMYEHIKDADEHRANTEGNTSLHVSEQAMCDELKQSTTSQESAGNQKESRAKWTGQSDATYQKLTQRLSLFSKMLSTTLQIKNKLAGKPIETSENKDTMDIPENHDKVKKEGDKEQHKTANTIPLHTLSGDCLTGNPVSTSTSLPRMLMRVTDDPGTVTGDTDPGRQQKTVAGMNAAKLAVEDIPVALSLDTGCLDTRMDIRQTEDSEDKDTLLIPVTVETDSVKLDTVVTVGTDGIGKDVEENIFKSEDVDNSHLGRIGDKSTPVLAESEQFRLEKAPDTEIGTCISATEDQRSEVTVILSDGSSGVSVPVECGQDANETFSCASQDEAVLDAVPHSEDNWDTDDHMVSSCGNASASKDQFDSDDTGDDQNGPFPGDLTATDHWDTDWDMDKDIPCGPKQNTDEDFPCGQDYNARNSLISCERTPSQLEPDKDMNSLQVSDQYTQNVAGDISCGVVTVSQDQDTHEHLDSDQKVDEDTPVVQDWHSDDVLVSGEYLQEQLDRGENIPCGQDKDTTENNPESDQSTRKWMDIDKNTDEEIPSWQDHDTENSLYSEDINETDFPSKVYQDAGEVCIPVTGSLCPPDGVPIMGQEDEESLVVGHQDTDIQEKHPEDPKKILHTETNITEDKSVGDFLVVNNTPATECLDTGTSSEKCPSTYPDASSVIEDEGVQENDNMRETQISNKNAVIENEDYVTDSQNTISPSDQSGLPWIMLSESSHFHKEMMGKENSQDEVVDSSVGQSDGSNDKDSFCPSSHSLLTAQVPEPDQNVCLSLPEVSFSQAWNKEMSGSKDDEMMSCNFSDESSNSVEFDLGHIDADESSQQLDIVEEDNNKESTVADTTPEEFSPSVNLVFTDTDSEDVDGGEGVKSDTLEGVFPLDSSSNDCSQNTVPSQNCLPSQMINVDGGKNVLKRRLDFNTGGSEVSPKRAKSGSAADNEFSYKMDMDHKSDVDRNSGLDVMNMCRSPSSFSTQAIMQSQCDSTGSLTKSQFSKLTVKLEDKDNDESKSSFVREKLQAMLTKLRNKRKQQTVEATSIPSSSSETVIYDGLQHAQTETEKNLIALNQQIESCRKIIVDVKTKFNESRVKKTSPRVKTWIQKLTDLEKTLTLPKTVIAVVGDTGSGKSCLLNALLDYHSVLPTSGIRACTAVVVEVEENKQNTKLEADIEFLDRKEWYDELQLLLKDLTGRDGKLKKGQPDPASDAFVSYCKVKAVYGRIDAYDALASIESVTCQLGKTKLISKSEPNKFKRSVEKFIETQEPGSGGQYWPIVKHVRLRLPNCDVCKSGAVLVDLPGIRDSNAARDRIAREYLKNCTSVWIVSNVHRAIDDKTAKNLLGESFRRQLLMDGHYGSVAFVCTKTDEITPSEIIRQLKLEDCCHEHEEKIQELEQQKTEAEELYQKCNRKDIKLCAEVEDLKKECEELREGLSGLLPDSESVADVDDEKEIHELKELKTELQNNERDIEQKELKRNHLQQQASIYNRQVLELDKNIHVHRKAIMAVCSRARNRFLKSHIRKDFKEGIREIRRKSRLGMEEEDEDYLADEEEEEEEETGSRDDLKVFCCSATEYQKLRFPLIDDGPARVCSSLADTEIPALRSYVHEITSVRCRQSVKKLVCSLGQVIFNIHSYIKDEGTGQRMTRQNVKSLIQGSHLQTFKSELELVLKELDSDIDTVFNSNIRPKLERGTQHARQEADSICQKWNAPVNKDERENGGLHISTYKAAVMRNGVYKSRAHGPVDMNDDLSGPMLQSITIIWKKAFSVTMCYILENVKNSVLRKLQRFTDLLSRELSWLGEVYIRSMAVITQLISSTRNKMTEMVTHLKAVITSRQREISRIIGPHIQESLVDTYSQACRETGAGMYARMKEQMTSGIHSKRSWMFDQAAEKLMQELTTLQRDIVEHVGRQLNILVHDVQVAFEPLCETPSKNKVLRCAFSSAIESACDEVRRLYCQAGLPDPETKTHRPLDQAIAIATTSSSTSPNVREPELHESGESTSYDETSSEKFKGFSQMCVTKMKTEKPFKVCDGAYAPLCHTRQKNVMHEVPTTSSVSDRISATSDLMARREYPQTKGHVVQIKHQRHGKFVSLLNKQETSPGQNKSSLTRKRLGTSQSKGRQPVQETVQGRQLYSSTCISSTPIQAVSATSGTVRHKAVKQTLNHTVSCTGASCKSYIVQKPSTSSEPSSISKVSVAQGKVINPSSKSTKAVTSRKSAHRKQPTVTKPLLVPELTENMSDGKKQDKTPLSSTRHGSKTKPSPPVLQQNMAEESCTGRATAGVMVSKPLNKYEQEIKKRTKQRQVKEETPRGKGRQSSSRMHRTSPKLGKTRDGLPVFKSEPKNDSDYNVTSRRQGQQNGDYIFIDLTQSDESDDLDL